MSAVEAIRRIAADDTISSSILRDFLMQALRHQAIQDVVIERMADRTEQGRLDVHGLSVLLPELIADVFDVATNEDWMATALLLIEDLREALLEEAES